MRLLRTAAFSCVVFAGHFSLAQQPQQVAESELAALRAQVQDTVRLLQQTRQELQSSRDELKALRAEVEGMKSSANPNTTVPMDSQDKIDQLAEAQAISESRIAQIDQTKVESGSKYRVKLSGLVLFNAGMNRGSVDSSDVPMLAVRHQPGFAGGDVNATLRQTYFTISTNGPDFAGARTSGDVEVDFFGGFPDTLDSVAFGLLRLRTAHANLEWANGSISFAQDQPFISPLSPTSLASVGTPAFGYSGNLWSWTPQVVGTRKFAWSENIASTFQLGMLDPFSGQIPPDEFDRAPSPGERSRVPALAARHALGFKIAGRDFMIGMGGLYSRQDYGFGRNVDSYAATADWMLPITKQFEVSGEFFRGRAIGGLWGGIGTSVVTDGSTTLSSTNVYPVNAIGGWTQLKYKPAEKWELNSAFGIDNPYSADLHRYSTTAGAYHPSLRNSTEMFNVIHRPRSNLVLSLEYRHLNTLGYTAHRYTAENVNFGFGVYF